MHHLALPARPERLYWASHCQLELPRKNLNIDFKSGECLSMSSACTCSNVQKYGNLRKGEENFIALQRVQRIYFS